ncbi:MAG: sigma 54-interacting transcriptional regulator [Acidobacteriota bacterium]
MNSAKLIVVRGPEAGLRFELSGGRNRIGASEDCDIVLKGRQLAPRHVDIEVKGELFSLSLLAPAAPCSLNGVVVGESVLRDGDHIQLGEVELLLRVEEEGERGHSLIAACSLFFLFRSMHGLDLEDQGPFEAQVREIAGAEVGSGLLDVFVGGTPADWAARLVLRGREEDKGWEKYLGEVLGQGAARKEGLLVQTFRYGPGHGACLLWHGEQVEGTESVFAALCAIASASLETAAEITNLQIRAELAEERAVPPTGILGESTSTRALVRQIEKIAPRDTTVLIQGESGTGKELVARALHRLSSRHGRPFVALNCAAIAENLLESELFGHEKGAFTGATEQRQGKLELAAGGTVFLDEIGEMPLALQAKMLRVLQQRECERVGGRKVIALDIRVVAATNRDLSAEVRRGAFREDLFHRLNVITLRTPPLRERGEDIELLARRFLARSAASAGRQVNGFSAGAMAALRAYDWPGNIRELENVVERAVVLGDLAEVQVEDLPDNLLELAPAEDAPAFHRSVHDAKRAAIVEAWRKGRGDYKAAAQILGVHPNSLLRMVRNLGLRTELEA